MNQSPTMDNSQKVAAAAAVVGVILITFGVGVRIFFENYPTHLLYLTLPYVVAGFALSASIYTSIRTGHYGMCALFGLGILTICGLTA